MHVPRLLGALVGVAIIVVGLVLIKLSEWVTGSLNAVYAKLPGHFQYPRWYIVFFGIVVTVFGGVIAILGVTLGQ